MNHDTDHNFNNLPVDAANVSVMTVEHMEAHKGSPKWALSNGCVHFVKARGTFKVSLYVHGVRGDWATMKTKRGFYVGDACYLFQRKGVWAKYLDGNDSMDDPQEGRITVPCDDGSYDVTLKLEKVVKP